MDKVRVDKWLWSVRIFKSRTISSTACKAGKVKLGDQKLKPSHLIVVGDQLLVQKNGYNLQFEVVKLLQKRVSAPLAQEAYVDHTPADELNKYEKWFVGKGAPEHREKGAGRPTKRERRILETFKDDYTEED